MLWSPRNKRPERLRDMIKEMEVHILAVVLFFCILSMGEGPLILSGFCLSLNTEKLKTDTKLHRT